MQTLPRDIHKGMTVYDSHRKAIGKIDDFKFPENEDVPGVEPAGLDGTDVTRRETFLDSLAEAFGGETVPDVLQARLLHDGYIRLDTKGLLAKDRFILPDQIASTTADEVMLNVDKDQLITRI